MPRDGRKDTPRHSYCPLVKCCAECGETKVWQAFPKAIYNRDGIRGICLQCFNARTRQDRAERPEYYRAKERQRQPRRNRCPEKQKRHQKTYRERNKTAIIARRRARTREDPQYRMQRRLRWRTFDALRRQGAGKRDRTVELMGCTFAHLQKHLESLWQPGMSWENYSREGWHIDHIIPCTAFDLTKEEEQRKCFHWKNLQPLWAADNIRKRDWVPDYQI